MPQGAPIRRYAVMLVNLPVGPNDGVIERRHRIPLARYFGSNALKYLRRQPRLDQNAQFGLAQHVDEPRRYHAVVSINGLHTRLPIELADGGNLAVANPNITRIPGRTRSINDPPVDNHQVELRIRSVSGRRNCRQEECETTGDTARGGYQLLPRRPLAASR